MKSSSTIEQRALTNEESKKLSAASIHAILCLARWNNLRLKAFHLRFHLLLAVARDNFALSLSSALLLCRWISFEIHEAPSRKGSCEFNSFGRYGYLRRRDVYVIFAEIRDIHFGTEHYCQVTRITAPKLLFIYFIYIIQILFFIYLRSV